MEDSVLEQITNQLQETRSLIAKFNQELQTSAVEQAKLQTELGMLSQNVADITRLLTQGNGAPSIMTRMALVEQSVVTLRKWLEEELEGFSQFCERMEKRKKEHVEKKTQWNQQIKIAIFAGGVAILGNIGNIIAFIKKLLA